MMHFIEQHSQGSHVAPIVLQLPPHCLWAHILQRSGLLSAVLQVFKGTGPAEVANFDGVFPVDQNVFWLDITQQDLLGVNVADPLQNLKKEEVGLPWGPFRVFGNSIEKVSLLTVFKNYVNKLSSDEVIDHSQNIGMVQLGMD